jgi:lipopolysaccharide export system protein LptA
MKTAMLAVLIACLLVSPGLSATKPSGKAAKPAGELIKYESQDHTLRLEAQTIEGTDLRLVATGKAHVWRHDPIAKTSLEASAERIVVIIAPSKDGKVAKGTAAASIKTANLFGPVTMIYLGPDSSGNPTKITACADNADFDGATSLAHLVGNVKLTSENPALFSEPAVMSGDKATVNVCPNVGPDGFRFRVESSPGVSTVTVAPKPKETQ